MPPAPSKIPPHPHGGRAFEVKRACAAAASITSGIRERFGANRPPRRTPGRRFASGFGRRRESGGVLCAPCEGCCRPRSAFPAAEPGARAEEPRSAWFRPVARALRPTLPAGHSARGRCGTRAGPGPPVEPAPALSGPRPRGRSVKGIEALLPSVPRGAHRRGLPVKTRRRPKAPSVAAPETGLLRGSGLRKGGACPRLRSAGCAPA